MIFKSCQENSELSVCYIVISSIIEVCPFATLVSDEHILMQVPEPFKKKGFLYYTEELLD